MQMRMTGLAAIAMAVLAGAPALAQEGRTAVHAPRAPAETLGLMSGDAERSIWIGAPARTGTGTLEIWVWQFTPSLQREGEVQRGAFQDEIDCAAGQVRRLGYEIYQNATFEFGYVFQREFREPNPLLQEHQLVPYVCAGRTPEVRVASPDEAQRHFRR
jgi:hypothetical protein